MADDQIELGDYEDRYLACRDLRHAWHATGYYRGAYGGVRRRLTCSRCGTWREDRWEGGAVRRTYEYPDGYRVPGRVHAVDVRDEILKRVTIYDSHDDMLAAVTKGATNGKRRTASPTRSARPLIKASTSHRPRKAAAARR